MRSAQREGAGVSDGYLTHVYENVAEFLAATEDWLLAKEAENNIVLSIAQVLATDDHPFHDPIYLASIEARGQLVGCAVAAPPDGLELTDLPVGVAPLLAAAVARLRPDLPWVGGTRRPVLEFERAWVRACGGRSHINHDWLLYRLDEVVEPRPSSGRLRLAEAGDWPELRTWGPKYAHATDTPVDVTAFLQRRLRRGELYVWDDNGPKSIVALSGHTRNVVRISAVYTPEEFRGRGYASNAVAAVSGGALANGAKSCVLLTDPEPAPPARIYRSIGYRPIFDHLLIELSH